MFTFSHSAADMSGGASEIKDIPMAECMAYGTLGTIKTTKIHYYYRRSHFCNKCTILFSYAVFAVACLAAVLSLQQFLPFVRTAAS